MFQVLLEFQNNQRAHLELPDLTVNIEEIDTDTTKFDLQLRIDEAAGDSGTSSAAFTYSTALFDPGTIDRFVDRFLRLLESITRAPQAPLRNLDILSVSERDTVLAVWNSTEHRLPPQVGSDPTLGSLFDLQVARSPYSIALVFDDEHVTYRELDERANQLARHLVSLGVGPESHVGLAIRRSADLLVGMYAIMKAGGAYVPIDPDHPVDRSAYVIDSAQPVCILTTSRDWIDVSVATPVLAVDLIDVSDRATTPLGSSERLGDITGANTAYVIYTSGSTGRPKGVAVSHEAIVNRLLWMQDRYRLEPSDNVLQKTPASFDVSVWEFFWPLQVGAKLVIAAPDGHRDPEYLSRVILRERITTLHFVPSMLAVFVDGAHAEDCESLRLVFCSGEALPPATVEAFAAFSDAQLHNLYGPTEAAVDVTSYHCVSSDPVSIPIGAPVWNTRTYVLDASLKPAPIGAPGELYLAGVQLARGYVGRGDLTADRFVADPYGEPGERLYRTGDLVRWRADGNLEYIGRTDFQVKLRGLRIELPEVESALLRHPSVARAVAVVHRTVSTGEALVAYVVPVRGATVDAAELARAVGESLPAYMVPSLVVELAEFPLNSSGKLDRKALPDPVFTLTDDEIVAPSNPVEEIIVGEFVALLGGEPIGVTQNFFAVGGNSLVAMRAVARINSALGSSLTVRDLFDSPTVRSLAAAVESQGYRTDPKPALVPVERPASIPVSLAQQRMWFINQYDTSSAAYNVAFAMRLTGRLDTTALRSALGDVVDRHEALRTVFPLTDDGPVQSILESHQALPDLTPIPAESEDDVLRLVTEVASEGFDVASSVPVRARLIEVGPEDHVLAFVVHHISSDGFSTGPLARDLIVAYSARTQGEAPTTSALPVQYADYSLWQRAFLGEESDTDSVMSKQLGFWVDTLSGAPDVLDLPSDRPRPAESSFRGAAVEFSIDSQVHARMTELATLRDSSVFMIVHASLAVLLSGLSASSDISVGTPIAGRGDAALDDLVGMFVNTLVLRTEIDAARSFRDLLADVRATDLAAFTHSDIPFERVVDALDPVRSTSHTPLFQVMLEFQHTDRPNITLPGLNVEAMDLANDIANFDLQLTVSERFDASGQAAGIEASFRYATDLFDAATVDTFAHRFVRIVDAVTSDSGVAVGDIDILSADELDALTPVRGATPMPPRLLPELLADSVASAGESAHALDVDNGVMTYGELDARSSRLARLIVDHGVGPGDVVALALPRGVDSIVAIWATAKAGAAFLPVDPTYPADRITHMITDSGAALGLTTLADNSALAALSDRVVWVVLDDPRFQHVTSTFSTSAITDAERVEPLRIDDAAYLIYTSGSTGVPKGVVVTHRGLANLAAEERSRFEVEPGSRTLAFASPSFDASVLEFVLAFGAGATMVIAPSGMYGGPDLSNLMRDKHVTHAFVTPAALATVDHTELPELRVIATGGDACPPELVSRWAPGRKMFNAYGPTEATIFSSISNELAPGGVVDIGSPTIGFAEVVLDSRLRPVPVGVPGELYLAGPALARGYHGRLPLTAERFVADPYGEPGSRMYRTGDVVRWNRAGALEFVGRSDSQVKVRGFRIELGEIDAAVGAHDGVDFATTAGVKGPAGNTILVTWFVAAESASPTVDAAILREHVAAVLPAHMVPTAFVRLESIPLTPAGKLDRRALPEPTFDGPADIGRAADTAIEKLLAGLFAEVLGLEQVGIDDSFFALGGDSIMSIQLVSRAKAAGLVLSPRDVFERKTVAALAEVASSADGDSVTVLEELPGGGVGDVPLTPITQWMIDRTHVFDRHTQTALLTLPDDIDRSALEATVQSVLDHHDMLRARLRHEDEHWTLDVQPIGSVAAAAVVHHVSVGSSTGDEFSSVASAELERAAARLAPASGSMIQFVWFEAADKSGRLLIVAHHLVVDGVSWRVLVPDLATAWAQLEAGEAISLLPVGTSMRRWAHGLADAAESRRGELALWKDTLSGDDPLVGSRALDPEIDVYATVDHVEVELSADVTEALLTSVPEVFHGSVNDGLMAGLALAVGAWRRARGIETQDSLVSLEAHGREDHIVPGADLSRTVGWFTTIYPVRIDLRGIDVDDAMSGGSSAGALIKSVKERLLGIPDHGIGFGMLRYLDDESRNVLAPLTSPQISFNYLGRYGAGIPENLRGVGWLPVEDDRIGDVQNQDLPVSAALDINAVTTSGERGDALRATFAYPSGVLERDDVEQLTTLWVNALTSIARHARSAGAGGFTPSDLDLVALPQSSIVDIEKRYPTLTDIWSMSPLQSGMLFHAELSDQTVDAYIVQLVIELGGSVDADRLHRSAQVLLDRHANLRSAFVHDLDGNALQVVQRSVDVPWSDIDLRDVPAEGKDAELDRILAADRATRFNMADAPLLRFTFVQVAEGQWRLVLTNHHILIDGWSTPLVIRELLTLYATDGDDAVLPRVPAYRDYLAWMNRRDGEAGRQAWISALEGLSEPTLLTPVESRRQESTRAGRALTSFDAADTTALRVFARDRGVTINTLVQAAWGTVLATLTGRTDVLFGATVSGRPPEINDIESMIGLFINTLPVRVTLDPRESLSEFVIRLQNEQAGLLDHHYLGLTEIQRAVGPVVAFDTLTVFESYPVDRGGLSDETDIAGLRVSGIVDGSDTAQYPLTLVAMADDRLHVEAKYLPEVFEQDAVETILGRIVAVLDAFATQPELPVGQLQLLSESERDLLIPVHGAQSVAGRLLSDVFADAVNTAVGTGGVDAIAVVAGNESVTYQELDARSSRVADVLRSRGVRPGTYVAVGLQRSIEYVVSVWAVAKAGGAFLPVDPSYPQDRIEHMLTDSSAPVGISVARYTDVLTEAGREVDWIVLDEIDWSASESTSVAVDGRRPDSRAVPSLDDAAYLIYTSGSTGVPKGVVVTHRGIADLAEEERTRFRVTTDSRVLAFASTSFDASVLEMVLAFCGGATMVIAPTDVYGGVELAAVLAEKSVTHAFVTPAALASVDPSGLDDLQVVVTGGDAAGSELVERWAPGRDLFNAYGPTEATVFASLGTPMRPGAPIDIGSPVRGFSVVVLDSMLRPVPVGVVGELYLSGPGVARGYHDRFSLTAERFVAAPFGGGVRMYRTGDVVRWSGSGVLEYVGRSDFQVKVRGFRIELGEIDSVVVGHGDVDFVTTVGVDGPSGATVLVSYVLPVVGAVVDVEGLREFVAGVLPSHMVPSAFVVLESIPLTPAGKLDRRALPSPTLASHSVFRAPRTDNERRVAAVFADLLDSPKVGIDDSFFDLGGNSLVATRLIARVNADLGSSLRVLDLFEAPTVVGLTARAEDTAGSSNRPALVRAERPDVVPLSLAQQRMWFINQFDTQSAAYNIPLAVRLSGAVDVAALSAAVTDVVERHESLRTVFPTVGELPRQVVLDVADVDLSLDMVSIDESALAGHVSSDAARGFDVTTDMPIRATLYRLDGREDRHVLAIVVHHIAADGASMAPLASDVMIAYSSRVAGEVPAWEPLAVQYADYSLWQRGLLGSESDSESLMSRQLAYWSRVLADAPDVLPLPLDRPRPSTQSVAGATTRFEIPAELRSELVRLGAAHDATPFMVFHSALALLLARLSGTEDIVVGTPIAGRGEAGLDALVGMFVGTLVLRTEVSAHLSFVELLAATRAADLAAFDNTDVPFERLVDEFAPSRSTDHSPLFQVLLEFQNNQRAHLELPDLVVDGVDIDAGIAKFDLQLTVSENFDDDGVPSGIDMAFTYATDLFEESTVREFVRRFSMLVDGVTAAPDRAIGDVDMLTDDEVHALTVDWNHEGSTPSNDTLAQRFEASAARFPDHTAVVFGSRRYTYAELDGRSNQLARHLVSRGVGPETLVAVAMPRNAELVVVLLAVLKAGGGYLPVDVTYPADRLAFMLEDARPVCVVSTIADVTAVPTDELTTVLLDDPSVVEVLDGLDSGPLTPDEVGGLVDAESIAYVIYTSGSTGRPKGVQVAHSTVATLFENTVDLFEFDETDVWTMFHSYAFDFSVWELWGPLLYGGTLVVVDYYTARSPELFRELLVAEQVTVLNQTPTAFYQFAEADRVAPADSAGLALRYIVFGGEALDLGQLGRWYARHPENAPTLVNMYGITETTVHVSHLALTEQFAASASASVIGQAIPGLSVSVRDNRLRLVPPGVTGEMYVSGGQLSRGYLGRAGLSATRFVADPDATDGARMYRTGDTARWNREGRLEYLGRSDMQVQLHGFRIELGEIESALLGVDGVAQSVVSVRDDGAGDRLVGYVVPEAGRTLDVAGVLDDVASSLTSYMVPAALVVLAELPLTANGKLDRKALPAPDFSSRVTQSRAPASEIEHSLAALFAEVLGLDTVGVDDSFFALGGDSIMSIQLVSRAKAAGLVIAPRDVFERKTVAGLAEVVALVGDADVVVLEELPGGGVGDLPLTPIVQWMLERSEEFGRYTQTALLQLPKSIDRSTLESTVQAILDTHDMLRAQLYRDDNGVWTETVAAVGSVSASSVLHHVTVDDVSGDAFSAQAAAELDQAADRLDPSTGRMIQMVWFESPSGAGRLLVVAHHLVIDGVSWRILVPDLASAWSQVVAGDQPALAPTGTSMRRWATGLVDVAAERTDELALWTSILDGPDPLIGARALDPTVDVDATVERIRASLPVTVTERLLTTVPEKFHGSVGDGLLAGLALALIAWRNERGADGDTPLSDALLSLEGHGREDGVVPGADLGRTMGWFTTIFPVRLDLNGIDVADAFAGGSAAGEAIKAVKEQLLAIPDHGIGFGMARYLTDEGRAALAGFPKPQVSFNYLGRFATGSSEGMDDVGWIPVSDTTLGDAQNPDMPVPALLDINAVTNTTDQGPVLDATFAFPSGVLTAPEVDRLVELWVEALTALTTHADAPEAGGYTPSDLELVDIDQPTISALENRFPDLDDVWSMSPLQSGLLFHARLAGEVAADVALEVDTGVDAYMVQLGLELRGVVDADRMKAAAQTLLDRHANLRTAFVHNSNGDSVQVVQTGIHVPWSHVDLSGTPDPDAALDSVLRQDRARRFALDHAPLLRFTLITKSVGADGTGEWRLLLTNHHILLDGWSTPLLIKELLTLYATAGDDSMLPRVPAYRDYLSWMRRRDAAASKAEWVRALSGVEEPTLLADADRGRKLEAVSVESTQSLSKETTAALRDLAAHRGATLNTIVQSAWGVVLAALTGRDDVVFGATVSGRPPEIPGIESMIGLFINTLPVRISLDPAEAVGDLVDRVQVEQASLLDHHYLGLTDIQRAAGNGVSFDTLTVFESYPVDKAGLSEDTDIAGLKVADVLGTDAAHYPLTLVASVDDRLHLKVKYLPELFTADDVERIIARISRVLHAVVENDRTSLARIDLLAESERAALAPVHGPRGRSTVLLGHIFENAAKKSTGRVALRFGTESLGYDELDSRSTRLARLLLQRGVSAESFVALGLPRSIESVVAVWAVAKTGAAFVPVDPGYPRDRIEHMVTDSGAQFGLTIADRLGDLPKTVADGMPWIVLDDPATDAELQAMPAEPLAEHERVAGLGVDSTAYAIYTSGSTGLPKGVVVTHSGLENFAHEQAERYSVTPESRTLHVSSPSFDASVLEYLLAFGAGATMVIVPPTVYGGEELHRILSDEAVTHAFITPSALASVDPGGLETFAHVVVGGEAVPAELVSKWAPGRKLYNGYGPTEATIMSNISDPLDASAALTIGGPIRGVHEVVLDSRLQPVPVGVTGELYLAGVGLARGYHDRPALSAVRFVADPFGAPGERMYRTGDLVRWRSGAGGTTIGDSGARGTTIGDSGAGGTTIGDSGAGGSYTIEYVGRSDFQVKVRGFRIELGEIDAVLATHPAVDFVATIGAESPSGATVLVAYVRASTSGSTLDHGELTAHASERLPGHMVPSAFVQLDDIPLTPVGKLDRRALPTPEFDSDGVDFVAPRTDAEASVAEVFAEILGADRVGALDNFFDRGGDSLSATRVIARVNAEFGTRIGVRSIFEAPTVAGLAGLVAGSAGDSGGRPVLRSVERPEAVPLSLAQQRMWFINRFDPASPAYNVPLVVKLTGSLDESALGAAVADVLERHESLRTTFPNVGRSPAQVIHSAADVIPEVTVESVRDNELVDALGRFAGRGFDVTTEIPIRLALYRTGEDSHVLAVVVHHIAADGASMAPLARDVMVAYSSRTAGSAPAWSPLEVQYADYTLWQRELLGSEDDENSVAAQQLGFWRTALRGTPDLLPLPTDRPRPTNQDFRGGRVKFDIDADLHRRVVEFSRDRGATMFMVVHSAFAATLARLSGIDDIAITTPVAGRGEAALDDLVGMFVNTLVLRTVVDGAESFESLLGRVVESDLEAFGHTEIPFERVVEVLNPTRSTSYAPLSQVALSFQNNTAARLDLPELTVEGVDFDVPVAKQDLQLLLAETFVDAGEPAGIDGAFDFATSLFDAATVQTFADRFVRILRAAVSAPSAPIGDADVLGEHEHPALAPARGEAGGPFRTWPMILADAAAANPDGIAVEYGDVELSYRQLDEWSTRIARMLIDFGVGPETFVALALPRSIESILSIWSVAKTGAAFLPVDPNYPSDRIAHMLDDSRAPIGLTVGDHRDSLPDSITWLVVDDEDFAADIKRYPTSPVTDADRVTPLHLDNPAYLIYTSGSTGRPKGVAVRHRGLANLEDEVTLRFHPTQHSRISHIASPSFDASIYELTMAFGVGATMVIVPPGVFGGDDLADLLERSRVTHAFLTPAALASIDPTRLGDVGVLAVGGEACTPELVARWAPGRMMFNGYGPTETTIQASVGGPLVPGRTIDVGSPAIGFRFLVLDARLRPVPAGVAGELYIAGPGTARGYVERFALTAERFVADPYGEAGERMYRTGDVVRWVSSAHGDESGELKIEFVGRSDFQVKVRGFRIELGEIDSVLTDHPALNFAATIGHTAPSGDTVLVSYVRTISGVEVGSVEVTEHVATVLPRHMVPTAIVFLDEIPLTPVGKLDRRALPVPELTASTVPYRAPSTATEQAVVDVFADVLGVERVGVDDNFFDLGGTSLVATRVVPALESATGVRVPLQALFLDPTPAGLAARVDSSEDTAGAGLNSAFGVVVPLRAEGSGDPLFCIHPGIGLSWGYSGIVRHLADDRPVYGLQLPSITEGGSFDSIQALAARYAQEIRRVRPAGPYNLLGWSLGGAVAHAVAVELRRGGADVDSLTIMDSYVESGDDTPQGKLSVEELLEGLGLDLPTVASDGPLTYEGAVELLSASFGQDTGLTPEHLERINDGFANSTSIMSRFVPDVFDGNVLFFAAGRGSGDGVDRDPAVWNAFIEGELEIRTIDCAHNQMIEPEVLSEVGNVLENYLAK
ncbi:non-ribosomal peptide synthetase [Rhodococcus fascians]|uniref:non-ribosomal peptide synthase/polyketide synthase n=1 Tax=Rhodococcoides fascians TaxID=1828 RepID=UPI00068C4258|nr:non-ribosomal peptide synthetase [Rhodococcus fascians]